MSNSKLRLFYDKKFSDVSFFLKFLIKSEKPNFC
jgi:hypothetical protein